MTACAAGEDEPTPTAVGSSGPAARAVGARLAPLIAQADAVVAIGPEELEASDSLEAAVLDADGSLPLLVECSPGAHAAAGRTGIDEVIEGLRAAPGVGRALVHWRPGAEHGAGGVVCPTDPGELLDKVAELLGSRTPIPPLLLVIDADVRDFAVPTVFDLVLSSASLALTPAELALVVGDRLSPQGLQVLREATGGVPALVGAALTDLAEGRHDELVTLASTAAGLTPRPSRSDLERLGRRWALRVVEHDGDDRLAVLLNLVPPLPLDVTAAVASRVLHRPVGTPEVRAAVGRRGSALPVEGARPCAPSLLARSVVTVLMERDRAPVRGMRREIVLAVIDPGLPVRTVDRIMVLAVLGDWDRLDSVLAQGMMALAFLTRSERTALVRRWPSSGDGVWPYLAAGRAFLDGSWRASAAPGPRPWQELRYLYGATESALLPPALRNLHGRVRRLTSHALVADGPAARADLEAAVGVLTDHVLRAHRLRDDDALGPQAHEYLARLLSLALQGAADACLGAGMVLRAQQCLNQARSLGQLTPRGDPGSRRTEQGLRVRMALLAATANLPAEAEDHLAAYEAALETAPCVDDDEAGIADVARLIVDSGRGSLAVAEGLGNRSVGGAVSDGYVPTRPLGVAAVGRALLVEQGPGAAGRWLHDELGRSRWAGTADWQWWPVHLTLALLDARAGRVEAAESWLRLGSVPQDGALVVRASAALAAGRPVEARELAAAALTAPGATSRWRLQAGGVLLGADPAMTAAVVARGGQWARSLDHLALLPEAARRSVAGLLALDPGWPEAVPCPRGAGAGTTLTARQHEILLGMERGLSSTQIAEELGVGTETVRTLTKRLYRRLNVHTRGDAVVVAREQGLVRSA